MKQAVSNQKKSEIYSFSLSSSNTDKIYKNKENAKIIEK